MTDKAATSSRDEADTSVAPKNAADPALNILFQPAAIYIDRFALFVGDGSARVSMGEQGQDYIHGRASIIMSAGNAAEFGALLLKLLDAENIPPPQVDEAAKVEQWRSVQGLPSVFINRFWIFVSEELVQIIFADDVTLETLPRVRIVLTRDSAWRLASTVARVLPSSQPEGS
jgi:hypothetical protein